MIRRGLHLSLCCCCCCLFLSTINLFAIRVVHLRRHVRPKPGMEGENGHFTPTMFVKVHKQGCAIARRINLRAHDNYESLRRALEEMSRNFLSNPYHPYIQSEEAQDEEVDDNNMVVLYENHEGNRMLVADAAWEVFVNTAKRLYIVRNPEAAATGKMVAEELLISSSQVILGGCFMYRGGGESGSSG